MPLFLYCVEDPVHPVKIDSAVEYIRREFPAWMVEPKVDRCRLGTPLCRRPVFDRCTLVRLAYWPIRIRIAACPLWSTC